MTSDGAFKDALRDRLGRSQKLGCGRRELTASTLDYQDVAAVTQASQPGQPVHTAQVRRGTGACAKRPAGSAIGLQGLMEGRVPRGLYMELNRRVLDSVKKAASLPLR